MSRRMLTDHAARLKATLRASLITQSAYRDMRASVENKQNGWTAQRFEDYLAGTESMFRHMKCIASTKDAVQLLDHAAKSLPEDMAVFDMRPEVPGGFLFLGEPLLSGENPIRAYVWAPLPDVKGDKLMGVTLVVMTLTTEGALGMKNWEIRPDRTLITMRRDMVGEDGTPGIEDALTDLRVVIAFNLLLAQGVTETEEVQPTRQMRRQHSRHGHPLDPVLLVQLPVRHGHSNGSGGVAIDWSHRWIVSGHWRKQWYSTDQVHRPKWIAPHIKGPDDKPLVVKEKRYVFDPKQPEE